MSFDSKDFFVFKWSKIDRFLKTYTEWIWICERNNGFPLYEVSLTSICSHLEVVCTYFLVFFLFRLHLYFSFSFIYYCFQLYRPVNLTYFSWSMLWHLSTYHYLLSMYTNVPKYHCLNYVVSLLFLFLKAKVTLTQHS